MQKALREKLIRDLLGTRRQTRKTRRRESAKTPPRQNDGRSCETAERSGLMPAVPNPHEQGMRGNLFKGGRQEGGVETASFSHQR